MANLKANLTNGAYLQNSLTLFLFFASWGIWWSFFQIWLTDTSTGLGLNGTQVGTVYAINSAVALGVMLFYGTIQDRLGTKRYLAMFVAGSAALVGPFVNWIYRPLLTDNFTLGAILGAFFFSCGFLAACGLVEALVERVSRRHGFEYGQARMWGSLGYALVALAAGFLFTTNPALNFWVGSVLGLLNLIIQVFWKPKTPVVDSGNITSGQTPSFKEMASLLKMPSLWVVIILVLFSWTFYTVFDQQMFPDFYVGLFPTAAQGQETYGILNSIQVFLEVPMLAVVPIIMKKIGAKNTLLLGVVVMCVRIFGCAVLDNPLAVSGVKLIHSIEVPMFILPMFRYFNLHFNPALSATLYLVGFNVSSQVGNVLLSSPLGSLRDQIGYQPTFLVISGVVFCAALFAAKFLQKDNEDLFTPTIDKSASAVPMKGGSNS